MSRLSDWQAHVLHPLSDALFGRSATSTALQAHALDFPKALEGARRAFQCAKQMGFDVSQERWLERHTLCSAFDRQDTFARFLGRPLASPGRLDVVGTWPKAPFVALFMHWGAGIPALEHLSNAGLQPSLVYRPERSSDLPSLATRLSSRVHMRVLKGFRCSIPVGGAYTGIEHAIASGRCPVIAIDVPPRSDSELVNIEVEGRSIQLRAGLMHLLARHRVPFVFFRCWHPPGFIRRRLEISQVCRTRDTGWIARQVGEFFMQSLLLDSSQWHFWSDAQTIIQPPD